MSNNIKSPNSSKTQLVTLLVRYIYPVLPLVGLIIISSVIIVHTLRGGSSLSSIDKLLYLLLIVLAGILIFGGILARTQLGIRTIAKLSRTDVDFIHEIGKRPKNKILESLVIFAFFLSIFLFSVDTKIAVYNLDAARYFNDTGGYVSIGSYSVFDANFWISDRAFTLPLLYKIEGYTLQNFTDQAQMEKVAQTQLGISIFSWTLLGLSVSILMKKWALKYLSFAIIVLMGSSINITAWDRLILSESLSTSLFVLLLAFLMLAARIWMIKTSLSVWSRIALLICAIIIILLFSFTRYANSYFLLSLGGLLMLGLLFRSVRRHKLLAEYMILMVSFFIISCVQTTIINRTSLFVQPLLNVFLDRFIPDKEKFEYLLEKGMPFNQRFLAYSQLTYLQIREHLLVDDPEGLLDSWMKNHGKKVLLTYMLTHPEYSLNIPPLDIQTLISGNGDGYRKILSPTPFRLSILTEVFYPQSIILPILFILLFGVSILLVFLNRFSGSFSIMILSIFITGFLLLLLIWNSDSEEMVRHALQVALQLRLASWLCMLLVVQHVWEFLDKFWSQNRKPILTGSIKALNL